MTPGERQLIADEREKRYLQTLSEEDRKLWVKVRENTRDGMKPEDLFENITSGFEYMEYVACRVCKEWMMRDSSGRGFWAVKHRNCPSFEFYPDLDAVPDGYTSSVSPMEILAGVALAWEDE